jgi:hypothetical protein
MRRTITFSMIGIVLASASTVLAHNTPWAWKPSRAAQMVVAEVTLQLPPSERASLVAEIREARSTYLLAEMVASEEGDWLAAAMYHNLVYRLTNALDKITKGLGVDTARCAGVGRAAKGRFKHFRCSASSLTVEIPTVASIERDGDKQIVVEGPPRLVGPLVAQLDVHVRGKTAISYRRL